MSDDRQCNLTSSRYSTLQFTPETQPLSLSPPPTEIRAQLVEQLRCLDQQCELRVQVLQDLQDFFRKKAEIEMDYSRNLEKLAERFLTKTRSTKDHQLKYEEPTTHVLATS